MMHELRLKGVKTCPKTPRHAVAKLGLEPRRLALVDQYTIILSSRFIIEKSKR